MCVRPRCSARGSPLASSGRLQGMFQALDDVQQPWCHHSPVGWWEVGRDRPGSLPAPLPAPPPALGPGRPPPLELPAVGELWPRRGAAATVEAMVGPAVPAAAPPWDRRARIAEILVFHDVGL
jgi:hypothetical protein